MCGIVGAIATRNVTNILVEGLKRLEYRGYDSAGVAIINNEQQLNLSKTAGKVSALDEQLNAHPLQGTLGIAHTRWATHGKPTSTNAHPHVSCDQLALVHNGIIENYQALKNDLINDGYNFTSETDTEVLVHLLHQIMQQGHNLFAAVQQMIPQLKGAYGIAVIDKNTPDRLVVARSGSPLIIGLGIDENFIASDYLALRQVTDRFMYLEEGDIAEITASEILIINQGERVERALQTIEDNTSDATKGQYKHYMLKEIYEQPQVIQTMLEHHLPEAGPLAESFTEAQQAALKGIQQITLVACGTSYHSALVAKYWLEDVANLPCSVEIASEFRYRKVAIQPNSLFITLSQSGETADTLAALRYAKDLGFVQTLAICNVRQSSLVRESDMYLMTHAGAEIGVASTKAFTTQITLLLLLTLYLAEQRKPLSDKTQTLSTIRSIPNYIQQVLSLDEQIKHMFESFADKHHALFLGRGPMYPIAMEGALKLKEISYIHAEAYAAGELKHGPLALVDDDMPVVAIAPSDELLEKIKSNLEEVQARGGHLFVFSDHQEAFSDNALTTWLEIPKVPDLIAPIIYTLPLQLLSYHVALLKGTDVDQPRNLAKSVTVE